MLHHTTIPWPPERMRRLIFSLSCSSGKAANVPKPVSFVIASSQITPTPLISSQTNTACLVSCDTQVMNCQNACVVVGPTIGAANPAGNAPCNLNCTTQQLVCKQA